MDELYNKERKKRNNQEIVSDKVATYKGKQ